MRGQIRVAKPRHIGRAVAVRTGGARDCRLDLSTADRFHVESFWLTEGAPARTAPATSFVSRRSRADPSTLGARQRIGRLVDESHGNKTNRRRLQFDGGSPAEGIRMTRRRACVDLVPPSNTRRVAHVGRRSVFS